MSENCTCKSPPILHYTKLYLEQIILPLIGAIGLVGNITAIIIICNKNRRNTFHQSLVNLAIIDILFLSIVISDTFCFDSCSSYMHLYMYLYPIKNILMSWETFLLMSIALERFLAVCYPLLYRAHKARHSPTVHSITYLVPSFIFSIAINIPKFFETKLITYNVTNSQNITKEEANLDVTDLR